MAVPTGIDSYYDNGAGKITDAAFDRLNVRSRMTVRADRDLHR